MLRIVKPKTRRARRVLEKRAPKLHENPKKALFFNGTKTSAVAKGVITDLYTLKKHNQLAIKYTRKNDGIRPFEGGGETSLEFMAQKCDCSLFLFASHSKKRPHNLVMGRLYDHHLYDMVELGVEAFKPMSAFGAGKKAAPAVGSKPAMAFVGEEFENNQDLHHLRNVLVDFFRGEEVNAFNLGGLDRAFIFVANKGKVYMRHVAIALKKSGTKVPRLDFTEVGPNLTLSVRRTRTPGEQLEREANRQPPKSAAKKMKNVSTDSMLGRVGRIYMPKQEVDKIALHKMKGLKRERKEVSEAKAKANGVQEGASGEENNVASKKPKSKKLKKLD